VIDKIDSLKYQCNYSWSTYWGVHDKQRLPQLNSYFILLYAIKALAILTLKPSQSFVVHSSCAAHQVYRLPVSFILVSPLDLFLSIFPVVSRWSNFFWYCNLL